MLPPLYCQCYADFQQSLEVFKTLLQSDPTPQHLQTDFLTLQQQFQRLLRPTGEVLEPATQNRLHAINTELQKQLRLLETDLLFFQTAKQPPRIQQRRQLINDRLQLLSRYCDALLSPPEEKL
uniref:Heterocyst frequency control protein PatD n=1 Tax=Cyanothece sp. (strain PCC 7425 / ATCC 29141) TaxID=395961 RepID=B8HYC3_CYAP4